MTTEYFNDGDDDFWSTTPFWTNETDRAGNGTDSEAVSGLGFLDSFVKALTAMLVSELGDKTFFLAAILAMRYNKLTIFLGSISSLIIMTVISALVGFGITSFIPPIYTYYAAIVIMFLFGFKMFWDAYRMKPDEGEQLQQEVEDQVDNLGKKIAGTNPDSMGTSADVTPSGSNYNLANGVLTGDPSTAPGTTSDGSGSKSSKMVNQLFNSIQFWKSTQPKPSAPGAASRPTMKNDYRTSSSQNHSAEISTEEGTQLLPPVDEPQTSKQKFLALFKIFINTFGLIFIAEWGDRSQIATIVLASVNDVGGIILGASVGHTICTGLAVIAGALVARWISVRVVTVIGGIVFIAFAIASLVIGFEDPTSTVNSV